MDTPRRIGFWLKTVDRLSDEQYQETIEVLEQMARNLGYDKTEDSVGASRAPLFDVATAVSRVNAACAAADATGIPLVINARVGTLAGGGEWSDMVTRANAYLDAGADVIFVLGLSDEEKVFRAVADIGGRISVIGRPGATQLTALGEYPAELGFEYWKTKLDRHDRAVLARVSRWCWCCSPITARSCYFGHAETNRGSNTGNNGTIVLNGGNSMSTDPRELGHQIARRRKELGLGQQDIAALSGVSVRSVYSVEHGKATARLDTIVAIAETLGLDLVLRPRQ